MPDIPGIMIIINRTESTIGTPTEYGKIAKPGPDPGFCYLMVKNAP